MVQQSNADKLCAFQVSASTQTFEPSAGLTTFDCFCAEVAPSALSGKDTLESPKAGQRDQHDPGCGQVHSHTNVEAQRARQDMRARERGRAWQDLHSAEMRSLAQAARVLLRNDAV